MDNKRINRNEKFCNLVRKKDVYCVLSNSDSLQCECAHIVPLNGIYGQTNYKEPELLNSAANGMLISKDLHFLYDQFVWTINPYNYEDIEGVPKKRKYNIEIVSNYKTKNLSINNYKNIVVRAESHNFIEMAYNIFKLHWNPSDFEKLEVRNDSKLFRNIERQYSTVDKLDTNILESLNGELNRLLIDNIRNKRNFNKTNKMEISMKYNLHHESVSSYYNKLKREYNKRL